MEEAAITNTVSADSVKPNRRDRRAKGKRITIADIRSLRARIQLSKLTAPKDGQVP